MLFEKILTKIITKNILVIYPTNKKGVTHMPKTADQCTVIRNDRKKQILDAALKVFAKRGLKAAKITDISTEANLSHGLIHHYFESKEEIFIEVMRQTIEMSSAAFNKISKIEGSPLEILKVITERNLISTDAEENALRWLFMINSTISDDVPIKAKEMIPTSYSPLYIIKELIHKGQTTGEIISGDSDKLSTMYWAMIQGLILFRYNQNLELRLPEADMIINILRKERSIQ